VMASSSTNSNRLLVGSTLGLMGGLLLVVAGRDVMEALDTGTYTTVLGLEMIDSSLAWIGGIICVISILGIFAGVWQFVMTTPRKKN
jgi:hypothetical protein